MLTGDIILTRNNDEVGNESPGYWNHSAICVGHTVVEAQIVPKHVIEVRNEQFLLRYPQYIILRYRMSKRVPMFAAETAIQSIGARYSRKASMPRNLRAVSSGENCVSVVRRAYETVLRKRLRWRKPDHMANSNLFAVVARHTDFQGWVMPESWFEGRVR